MSEKKYPIGGYAPGNYQCHCGTCGGGFIGDKRAYQCESCAIADKEKFDALSPTEQEELMKRNAELIKGAFKDSGKGPAVNHDRVIASQVAGMPLEEAIFQDGYSAGVELEKKRAQSISATSLIPGAPTITGTYFAVIKCYVSDDPQMCVLHYQAHKSVYRAAGHAFSIEVKAEDVVGYVGEREVEGSAFSKWILDNGFARTESHDGKEWLWHDYTGRYGQCNYTAAELWNEWNNQKQKQ